MVDVDSETLFNGATAAVATIAVVLFVFNVEFRYSPVSKVALVVLFLGGVFALTQRAADRQLILFGYGVVVVSVVALFFEVMRLLDAGNVATVLGLLAIAALLFGLRTRLDGDSRFVSGKRATYAFGVLAVIVTALVLLDVVTGSLTYELRPRSEVEVTGPRHEAVRVASVVVSNPTPIPERVEMPDYTACAAGNWSAHRPPAEEGERPPIRVDVHVRNGHDEHVVGFGSETYPAMLRLEGVRIEGETVPVERTSACPDTDAEPPYIAIYETDDGASRVGPV